jgi:hypothetical protein
MLDGNFYVVNLVMTLLLARQQCFVAATKWRDKAQPYKNYIFFHTTLDMKMIFI